MSTSTGTTSDCNDSASDGSDYMQRLCASLLQLFSAHCNEDRVALPLLKTVELLLRNGVFENMRPHEHAFPMALVS